MASQREQLIAVTSAVEEGRRAIAICWSRRRLSGGGSLETIRPKKIPAIGRVGLEDADNAC
tara:strand:+ start:593 stop:775 length:183 start_codon:yes stop_codon:yes gene_type:complete